MTNNPISRTSIGSASPFDLVKGDQQDDLLNLDNLDTTKVVSTPIPQVKVEPITPEIPDEDEGEDDGGEQELPSNAKVKIKTNIPKLMAERMKADGQLPEDFEVEEKTTAKDVEDAYRKFMSDKLRQEERNEALEELRSDGYDERSLKSAQRLHYGVTEQEIRMEEAYSMLGNIQFDSSDENYEKSTKVLFQQYYLDKGLPAEEAERNANRDFEDDEVESLIQNRQGYFTNRAIELDEAQKKKVENAQLAEKTRKEESINKVNTYLDKRIIDGVTYTPQEMETVRKALFEKSEVIVNEQGQRVRVTPYYKKKYERAKNEEQTIKDIVDFVLGYDVKKVTEKAKRSARTKLVDDLNDLIEVDVELTPTKTLHKTDPTAPVIVRKPLG